MIQCVTSEYNCKISLNQKYSVYLNFISIRKQILTMFTGVLKMIRHVRSSIQLSLKANVYTKGIVLGPAYFGH